jgi:2-dehydro-3-deoxygluconokinase
MALDLLAFGEPLFEFAELPDEPGKYLRGFGGDTTNLAIAAARLGARVGVWTALGDDPFGQSISALLAREGVDATHVNTLKDAPTGGYFIHYGAQGHSFSYARAGSAASRITLQHVHDTPQICAAGSTQFFHTSGITQAISESSCVASLAAVARAHANNIRVSYDLNFRARLWTRARACMIAEQTLPAVDVFLPSVDEAREIFGLEAPDDIIAHAHHLGARQVALKMGAAGARVSDGRTIAQVAGFVVNSVDATGAGDCFGGALLTRLARGDALVDAARYACAAAALATTGRGAIAPLPRAAAVAALLATAS